MHTDIHASSGIRSRDPSVRVDEGSSCLRPRGHSDRHYTIRLVRICQNEMGVGLNETINSLNHVEQEDNGIGTTNVNKTTERSN
jgi:hypothetical protein